MRPWLLLAPLAALGCHDDGGSKDDTDVSDTEVVTTVPRDTDVAPVDSDLPTDTEVDDSGVDDTGRPVCFDPVLPPSWPATWDDLVDEAASWCFQTFRCGHGTPTVLQAWYAWPYGTGADLRYDGSGTLFSVYEGWHSATCDHWFGEVAAPCTTWVEAEQASPGCAYPAPGELPWPGSFSSTPLSQVAVGDYDPATIGDSECVGTATCTLGERTLTILWRRGWATGNAHAWEGGTLVAATTASFYTLPAWVGEDLSACGALTFTPSAGCGVVQLLP